MKTSQRVIEDNITEQLTNFDCLKENHERLSSPPPPHWEKGKVVRDMWKRECLGEGRQLYLGCLQC